MRQLEVHKIIDEMLLKSPDDTTRDEVLALVSTNDDARQYFYAQADERWLGWLWENNFLDVIKEGSEDPTKYSFRTPELNYLVRMAVEKPEAVVDIMHQVPIAPDTFNPEVVDQFLHISAELPAVELTRKVEGNSLIKKIRDEEWVQLMSAFNHSGYEYERIFQTLAEAGKYESVVTLAEAVLAVRDEEDPKEETTGVFASSPFYFSNLFYAKVLEHLAKVDDAHAESALKLVAGTMSEIVSLGGEAKENKAFPTQDTFHLLDVDFFTLELGKSGHMSSRDDVRELAAAIKVLVDRLIKERCEDSVEVQRIYSEYIGTLPQSRSMWRLRLYVLSLCPEVFKAELKDSFFRLFDVDRYHEVISGTEYYKALQKSFSVLPEDDKKKYVEHVIVYFSEKDEEKENAKEDWHLKYGAEILSMISDYLEGHQDLKQQASDAGLEPDPDYEPESSIGQVRGGVIRPKGPSFGDFDVAVNAKKLKSEWVPEKLSKQNTNDNFTNPLNAEGAGKELREDIAKRLQQYVEHANLFFDRENLDAHYTYSFLRGIQEAIKDDRQGAKHIDWGNLISMLLSIKDSGVSHSFETGKRERERFGGWLVNWDSVHSYIADIIKELLREDGGEILLDFTEYRDDLLSILSYLLNFSDPQPKDEEGETAISRTKVSDSDDYVTSDPFSIAINTVRGRAFQTLVLFTFHDGKQFEKGSDITISGDVKDLYEGVLENENTRAIMFMFGHYLPSFYFRDKERIRGLLPQIFPREQEKHHLYLAAWEGYLAGNLYEELFFEDKMQELYRRGLTVDKEEGRRYFKDPDEGIATHIALATVAYCERFNVDHPLFRAFWGSEKTEQHKAFISTIGRMFVSGDNVKLNEFLDNKSGTKERIKDLWDWVLDNCEETEVFTEFGFWVNLDKEIFDASWLADRVRQVLDRTEGRLKWAHGLEKSIKAIAKVAPQDTLNILRLYFTAITAGRGNRWQAPREGDEWMQAFEILYKDPNIKDDVEELINDLITGGGQPSWVLKQILD